MSLISLHL
jgi:hypothetical protein